MAFLVRVADSATGKDRLLSFESSPVRIGRNKLNEIVFDQLFVSAWHTLVRFQGTTVTIMDLGSTNGTSLNGQKLQPQMPAQLQSPNDVAQIGSIRMTFGFAAAAEAKRAVKAAAPKKKQSAWAEQTMLDVVDPAEWLIRLRGESAGEARAPSSFHVRLAMERVAVLLETFGRSYVELRNGSEQFGSDMGLNIVTESSPLHDAKTFRIVLDYLLDWDEDGGARVEELTRAFADLGVHQVALLNGVMAGVRELLDELTPKPVPWYKKILPFGMGSHLSAIEKQRKSLRDEDHFSHVVFGKAFARAYYAVSGGIVNEKGDQPEQEERRPQPTTAVPRV